MASISDLNKNKDKNLTKNYIILIIIFLVVIGITAYLCSWYRVYDDYKKQTPVIRGTLQEITYDDFEHYILENPTTVIYMCIPNDDKCRSFEKSFTKYVKKKDLSNEIIYLNLSNINNADFVKSFNDKYKFKTKLNGNYPAFVVFNDGKIDAILQGKDNEDIDINKVDNFLELNEIEGVE